MSDEQPTRQDVADPPWGVTRWWCEDCGVKGEDAGVPEHCPSCGSPETAPDA